MSKHPVLESLFVKTSNLQQISIRVIILKNIMKKALCVVKDNGIKIDIECMNGRGKRELIKIPSV